MEACHEVDGTRKVYAGRAHNFCRPRKSSTSVGQVRGFKGVLNIIIAIDKNASEIRISSHADLSKDERCVLVPDEKGQRPRRGNEKERRTAQGWFWPPDNERTLKIWNY